MTDIIIKENTVEMTIIYVAEFSNESEMIEGINGAVELRGLVPTKEESVKPHQEA